MLWNQARKYLCMKDKELSRIIRKYDGKLESRNNPFYSLCKSIVGQQVSVASADAVWNRLLSKCKEITPENINNLKINDLKDCGFSRQKIIYITELSKNFINKKFNINKLSMICHRIGFTSITLLSDKNSLRYFLISNHLVVSGVPRFTNNNPVLPNFISGWSMVICILSPNLSQILLFRV